MRGLVHDYKPARMREEQDSALPGWEVLPTQRAGSDIDDEDDDDDGEDDEEQVDQLSPPRPTQYTGKRPLYRPSLMKRPPESQIGGRSNTRERAPVASTSSQRQTAANGDDDEPATVVTEHDSSPQDHPSRAHQTARKSTGKKRVPPSAKSLGSEAAPSASSASRPLLAENPSAGSSRSSPSGSTSTEKQPRRTLARKSTGGPNYGRVRRLRPVVARPRPSVTSTSNAWTGPSTADRTRRSPSVICISSDEDEAPLLPRPSTTKVKKPPPRKSDTGKQAGPSSFSALFSPAKKTTNGAGREGSQGWDNFAASLNNALQQQQGTSANRPSIRSTDQPADPGPSTSTTRRPASPAKQTTLDGYVQSRPSSPTKQSTLDGFVASRPGPISRTTNEGDATMAYTPSDFDGNQDEYAPPEHHVIEPDMRGMEEALGFSVSAFARSRSRAATPTEAGPSTVKQQPFSPAIAADKKGKQRAERQMDVAGAFTQNAEAQRSKKEKKKVKKKRQSVVPVVKLSGFGSKDDPFTLDDSDDDAGKASATAPVGGVSWAESNLNPPSTVTATATAPLPPLPVRPPAPPPTLVATSSTTATTGGTKAPALEPAVSTSTAIGSSVKDASKGSKLKELLEQERSRVAASTPVPIPRPASQAPVTPSIASVPLAPTSNPTVSPDKSFTETRGGESRGSSEEQESRDTSAKSTPSSAVVLPSSATKAVPVLGTSMTTAVGVHSREEGMEDEDDDLPTLPLTGPEEVGTSDENAAMEVDDLLVPSRQSSAEIEDITVALGSQDIANGEPSRQPSSDEDEGSPSTPEDQDNSEFDVANDEDDDDELALVPGQPPPPLESKTARIEKFKAAAVTTPARTGASGFQQLTFHDYRLHLQNTPFEVYYARDLPHSLQDGINNTKDMHLLAGMRDLFKAFIQEHTVQDEPDAPPIDIINNIDDEPAPPWEFHYSNQMWHSDNVPPPDVKNLEGCDCVGRCTKSCACLRRQKKLLDPEGPPGQVNDFMYDKKGRLRHPEFQEPIVECNALCGCDQDCVNRVVQNGRKVQVSIQKTKHKGWGVFAGPKKIPKGTFLGVYSGELLTDEEGDERGKVYNKFGRTYLFNLDFWFLKANLTPEEAEEWDNKYVVDAFNVGNNHSCDPNCKIHPCFINEANKEKPLLTVFTDRDIDPYEEICFNYTGMDADEAKARVSEMAKTDKIYEPCMCGAKNCCGVMFE
ncbi:hypothetical protein CC1G_12392 [Coprinopsis cinerea okayama7|uniref:SET domain-containing protein n=1 Tax=Coprinopsis cinerea (strain Okayama-7 / 130 / ATCC MYA-4618 / FGSC 9003) TaxID=240176 RepID=A8NLT5_COPC7|nr:hypothetical protein CC1G_12392 [Coprinopsis cinerea okayama7\|eukprot:XP_001834772.2 hypothetical protein CC1G_12392 [Coprinopsis cinerea okayama7\